MLAYALCLFEIHAAADHLVKNNGSSSPKSRISIVKGTLATIFGYPPTVAPIKSMNRSVGRSF
jgi:hypothetical protein